MKYTKVHNKARHSSFV